MENCCEFLLPRCDYYCIQFLLVIGLQICICIGCKCESRGKVWWYEYMWATILNFRVRNI